MFGSRSSRPRRPGPPDTTLGTLALTAVITIGLAACGGRSSDPAPTDREVVGEAQPADTIATTATTATTPDEPAETGSSTAAPTDGPPPTSPRLPPREETPLAAGEYRTTALAGPVLQIDFDLAVDGLYALDEEGVLAIASGSAGERTLVTVFHLDNGVALEPTVDPALFADRAYLESVAERTPADLLAWFDGRPGVTLGPIEEGEFGGVESRSRSVEFGAFDGAVACSPPDERVCHWLLHAPVTGLALVQNDGDRIVVHELTVAGHRLAVLVDTSIDEPTATAIATSMRFEEIAHPSAPAGSSPLPFAGPLEPGTTYVHERSTGGVWLVDGRADVDVSVGFLRDRFVRLASDGEDCFSFTDATQGFWWGVPTGPNGEPDGEPRKTTDDLATLIEGSTALDVVAGPFDVPLGEVVGIAYDLRPAGDDDVVLATTSITARAGQVTRVVGAPRTDGSGADLVMAGLGTACEAILDGLVFLPGADR